MSFDPQMRCQMADIVVEVGGEFIKKSMLKLNDETGHNIHLKQH